jgi:hypothetical protein
MGMSKNFAVYFPNTGLITEILADTWDLNNNCLKFYAISCSEKTIVAVFNMSNILGFKEIKVGREQEDDKIPEEIAGGRSANVSGLLNKENMQRATGKGL